jgi:hypothetical protein
LLSLWNRLSRWPAGGWLFSRAVCFKAPYFGTIAPRITLLEAGRCEARIADRRRATTSARCMPSRCAIWPNSWPG